MHGNLNVKHVSLTVPAPVRQAMVRVSLLKSL
jgi:hypothetical protein